MTALASHYRHIKKNTNTTTTTTTNRRRSSSDDDDNFTNYNWLLNRKLSQFLHCLCFLSMLRILVWCFHHFWIQDFLFIFYSPIMSTCFVYKLRPWCSHLLTTIFIQHISVLFFTPVLILVSSFRCHVTIKQQSLIKFQHNSFNISSEKNKFIYCYVCILLARDILLCLVHLTIQRPLHKMQLQNLYCCPKIIRVIKSRMTTSETRDTYGKAAF